jgi:Glycosyl transferase 4-like domain
MNDAARKTLLIVAYHFHPDLEVGAIRSVKFAKYLPEFGWEPHVVTAAVEDYERVDPAPLPFACAVERAATWPSLLKLGARLSRKVRRRGGRPDATATATSGLMSTAPDMGSAPFWKRLLLLLGSTPDIYAGWLVPAAWRALKAARREGVDVIYTSGPPATGHLVGLIASWLSGRPLVSDFRDPWTTGRPPDTGLERFFLRIDRWLETRVVRRSTLVLAATPGLRNLMVEAFRPDLDSKCVALINGFDADDFPAPAPRPAATAERVLSFVYAGTLYAGRDPGPFVAAIGEMLAEGALDPGAVSVDFYGPVEIDTASVEQALDRFALHDVVRFHSSVSRQQCLDILGRADVLLLLQTDDLPWALPAKNFEYLATGNEILLLSGPYELATFLEPYDNVHRANPHDVPAIKTCIARIVDRLRSGTADRERNLASLSPLYKRALTREFARLLDTVVATDQPARDR